MKRPSIDVCCIDDAVDKYLMPRISDSVGEEDEEYTEELRTELRVAIKQVLAEYQVMLVDSWSDAVRACFQRGRRAKSD